MNRKESEKTFLLGFIVICLVFSSCGAGNKELKMSMYLKKAEATADVIIKQASACTSLARSYMATWEYARVSGIDFAQAMREMYGQSTTENKIMMKGNKLDIDELVVSLENPPSGCEEIYEMIKTMHQKYSEIHFLVLEPLEDMEKFQEMVMDLENDLMDLREELESLLISLTKQV